MQIGDLTCCVVHSNRKYNRMSYKDVLGKVYFEKNNPCTWSTSGSLPSRAFIHQADGGLTARSRELSKHKVWV